MQRRLQPHVVRAAALCNGGCISIEEVQAAILRYARGEAVRSELALHRQIEPLLSMHEEGHAQKREGR